MLFDADAVCRAAFCREVAQGAGPRLHDAALCAVLVQDGMAAASAGGWAAALHAGTLCLCPGSVQLAPAESCRALCVGCEGAAAQQAAKPSAGEPPRWALCRPA